MILNLDIEHLPTFPVTVDGVEYTVTVTSRRNSDPTYVGRHEFRITGPGTFATTTGHFESIAEVIRREVAERVEKSRKAKEARDRRAGRTATVTEPLPAYLSDGTRIRVRGLHASRSGIVLITRPDKRTRQSVADEAGRHQIVRDLTVDEKDEFRTLLVAEANAAKVKNEGWAVARRISDPEVRRLMTGQGVVTFNPVTGLFVTTTADGTTYSGETIGDVSDAINARQVAETYPVEVDINGKVEPLERGNFSGYARVMTEAEAFVYQGDHAVWAEARDALDTWVKAHLFDLSIYGGGA